MLLASMISKGLLKKQCQDQVWIQRKHGKCFSGKNVCGGGGVVGCDVLYVCLVCEYGVGYVGEEYMYRVCM